MPRAGAPAASARSEFRRGLPPATPARILQTRSHRKCTRQFWLYYQDSTWLGGVKSGGLEHHEDDWEGVQVRVTPDGVESRATSHNGYNYDGGVASWPSDLGIVHRSAWGDATGKLYVSGGSHAGHVHEGGDPSGPRWTPRSHLRMIPIETLDDRALHTRFAISPPWAKNVYRDPEDQGT